MIAFSRTCESSSRARGDERLDDARVLPQRQADGGFLAHLRIGIAERLQQNRNDLGGRIERQAERGLLADLTSPGPSVRPRAPQPARSSLAGAAGVAACGASAAGAGARRSVRDGRQGRPPSTDAIGHRHEPPRAPRRDPRAARRQEPPGGGLRARAAAPWRRPPATRSAAEGLAQCPGGETRTPRPARRESAPRRRTRVRALGEGAEAAIQISGLNQ